MSIASSKDIVSRTAASTGAPLGYVCSSPLSSANFNYFLLRKRLTLELNSDVIWATIPVSFKSLKVVLISNCTQDATFFVLMFVGSGWQFQRLPLCLLHPYSSYPTGEAGISISIVPLETREIRGSMHKVGPLQAGPGFTTWPLYTSALTWKPW